VNDERRWSRADAGFVATGDAPLEARIARTVAVPPGGLRGRVLGEVGRCLAGDPGRVGRKGAESWSSPDGVGSVLAVIGAAAIALSLGLAVPLPRVLAPPRSRVDAVVRRELAVGGTPTVRDRSPEGSIPPSTGADGPGLSAAGITPLRRTRPLLLSLLEELAVSEAGPTAVERPDDGVEPPAWSRPPSAGLHLSTTEAFTGER